MSSSVASARPDWAAWTRVLSVMFRRWRHLVETPTVVWSVLPSSGNDLQRNNQPEPPCYLTGHSRGTQIVNRVYGPNFRGPGASFPAGPAPVWRLSSCRQARPRGSLGGHADRAGGRPR